MTDAELLADRAVARQLTRSWDAFFARFGRLTNVQRAAIPDILGGRSVLVSAPTAAGKTEAACAPLMERMLRLPGDWRVIYVSPTRALVNDLFERLRNPLERLNVRLARRTGEYRSGAEEAQVLLTTPESLDSMLCRGRIEGGHLLAASAAVVLDEIHLLASSARGEQVRWLLARLRRLRRFAKQEGWVQEDGVQVVALSATVPDLAEVQRRFVQDGRVIQVAGGRTIEEIELDGGPFETETAVPVYLAAGKSPEKILIFCHARRRVDRLAQQLAESLAPLGYVVRAHHGSLAQSARETAEDEVRRERKIVLVATSTLEIGVDIGDIDLVVLDSPARDIASLLQRLGRGNRRSGKTRVLVCGATVAELIVHEAMLAAARDGRLGEAFDGPQYAVAIQQVCSFILQSNTNTRERETLLGLLRECLPEQSAEELVDHLIANGVLAVRGEKLALGEEAAERAARGSLHSNIESGGGSTVVNERTGDAIASGVIHKGGSTIGVGGVTSEIRSISDRKIHVRRADDQAPNDGSWAYVSRRGIVGPGQPTAVREHLGVPADEWPVIESQLGSMAFHFGDARTEAVIRLIAAMKGQAEGLVVDEWSLQVPARAQTLPHWLRQVDADAVNAFASTRYEELERVLGRPYANSALPVRWRVREVEQWLGTRGVCERLARARLVPSQDLRLVSLVE